MLGAMNKNIEEDRDEKGKDRKADILDDPVVTKEQFIRILSRDLTEEKKK